MVRTISNWRNVVVVVVVVVVHSGQLTGKGQGHYRYYVVGGWGGGQVRVQRRQSGRGNYVAGGMAKAGAAD